MLRFLQVVYNPSGANKPVSGHFWPVNGCVPLNATFVAPPKRVFHASKRFYSLAHFCQSVTRLKHGCECHFKAGCLTLLLRGA